MTRADSHLQLSESARIELMRRALLTIRGPASDGDAYMNAYRAAGGGYEGLQAIAEAALKDAAKQRAWVPERCILCGSRFESDELRAGGALLAEMPDGCFAHVRCVSSAEESALDLHDGGVA